MQRLSASSTFLFKGAIPVLMLGVAFVFFSTGGIGWQTVCALSLCAVVGFTLMRTYNFTDEVWLDLDAEQLLVKNRGKQWRIPLTDIGDVEWQHAYKGPDYIELSLLGEWPTLGSKVKFLPSDSNSIDDLKLRIDARRRIDKYR